MAAIALIASAPPAEAKCDAIKELKPEVQELMDYVKEECAQNSRISLEKRTKIVASIDAAEKELNIEGKSDFITAIHWLKGQILDGSNADICNDKAVQDKLKQRIMTDIGVSRGMKAKKEVEADCPKFKAFFDKVLIAVRS
ncbi:hypothetical protein [Nocardia colli]|uniref:hypothetical protein n=1 Tax=Nocardia colli TaxID=2545717 RepID=UPI0035DD22EA